MQAILFVGHGSKDPNGNKEILQFVDQIRPRFSEPIIETCYLEFAQPDISRGIDRCIERGATSVSLVPMMFLAAGHSKLHIPAAIDEAKVKYPTVTFNYGRPVGIHNRIIDMLENCLREQGLTNETEDAIILLIGRGSSDPDANSDLYKIGRLLSERFDHLTVESAFIGVTKPTVEDGVARAVTLGAKQVFLVPYLFFTGVLMNRMHDKLAALKEQYPAHQLQMTDYFGFRDEVKDVFQDRVEEALLGAAKLNCDVCEFRLHALEHMDVHHHHHHDHDHDHDHHHHHHHAHEEVAP
ncbi:sirohydrochlorin chelatase [Sporosarcina sp. FSL W7-1349]|uniref:sirohydrochlorin chelatase n=1 Tax=Sporosarcina sp. FSL W7-1349 TaxID=2921561 RepID=UPI0030F51FA9